MRRSGIGTSSFASLTRVAILACLALAACEERTGRPNVPLITVDTLRADRIGSYGADVATPHIARLAAAGSLFEAATSPMQITRPSHFSLFTSVYPRDHGAVKKIEPSVLDVGFTSTEFLENSISQPRPPPSL